MNRPGKWALVTGASLGIGFEIARILRAKGYDLVLVSRSQERLEAARHQLGSGEGDILLMPFDLARAEAAESLYDRCRTEGIQIDLLVNNAGFGLFGEHSGLDTARVRDLVMLNAMSLSVLCNLFGREMKHRHSGLILNVASTASYQPIPQFAAYAASKSYVLSFSQALAAEMRPYGVGVTCLCPGPTDTSFFEAAGVADDNIMKKKAQMSARQVAEVGLNGLLAGRRTVIPGWRNRLLAIFGYFTPRALVLWLLNKVLAKA